MNAPTAVNAIMLIRRLALFGRLGRRRRIVLRLVVMAVCLLTLAPVPADAASAPLAATAEAKISPWARAALADGGAAEFLVVLGEQADLRAAARLHAKQAKGRFVYRALWQTAQATQAPLLAWLAAHHVEHRSFYIVNLIWVKGDAATAQALAARPDVARIEANPLVDNSAAWRVEPHAGPLAPAGVEPNLGYVRAPAVWALGATGQGIVVGIQDTGFDWTHPALKPHYRGWDGASAEHDYNWHDSIHTAGIACGADAPAPCDDLGHGTHALGIAVGDDGLGHQIGMAPGAQWIGCRNMNNGVGSPASYLECFEFFLAPYPVGGTPEQGNPDLAPDVTNNSWGCPPSEGCSANTLLAAVEAQRAAGILTVASAGNNGLAGCASLDDPPAVYAGAYTVGALNTGTDSIAAFSSRGPVDEDGSSRRKPDLSAPGTSVVSSQRGGSYTTMSGTSMAAPHVAGAVALLWSARPALKHQVGLTEQVLDQSAFHLASTDCGSSAWPNNTYGYGRLDVLGAVNSVPAEIGSLTGTATDTVTGGPIARVTITASNHQTPTLQFTAHTDPSGSYAQLLPPGTYTVTTASAPYPAQSFSAVSIVSGTVTILDFPLTAPFYWRLPLVLSGTP